MNTRILTGALALIVLGTIVQPDAAKRTGQLIDTVSGFARRFLDPAVPAIGAAPKSPKDTSGSSGGGLNLFGTLLDSIPGFGSLHILGLTAATTQTPTAVAAPASPNPAATSLPLPTAGPSSGGAIYA